MIKSVRDFERSNKELLARNRKYLRDRDYLTWSEPTLDLIRAEYNVQKAVVTSLYSRLEYFIKLHELNLYDPTVQTVARRIARIIQIHVDRVDKYLKASNKESLEGTEEEKSAKLLFDNELYKDINKIKNDIEALRIDEGKKAEGITFFDNAVCPLMMHPIIIREYPEVDALLKDMKIDFDSPPKNKMLIQYDKDDIPYWDARLHYWEQTPEALQFYVDEFKKIKNGIKLGDYYIEPWLYVHLNVCVYNIPTSYKNKLTGLMENRDTPQNPPLRDNEWWIIQDNYQKAKEEKKYLFLCASRRVAKTTSKASMAVTTVLQGKAQTVIAGGSDSDLGQLTNAIKFSLNNQHPAFQIPRQGSEDWNDQVDIAVKRMNRKNISEQAIYIRNTRAGGKRSDQILAGFAMDALLYDEIMKAPFIKQLEAADPALHSNDVLRAIPILSGTGGNELLSRDALSVLNNLSINKIYEMDWDLFESRIPDIEYNRTWRRDPFATFIPAQMSSKEGLRKIEMNLSDYLKTDSKDFDGLKIQVTDWTYNNDVMDKQEEDLKVDRSKLVSSRVSFPRCPKYIFLSGQESPFPNEEVSVFLMDKDLDRGTNVDISQDGSKNIILSPTNKTVATFPFGGGSHNGPITIFEEPVSNPPRDFYVAGLDDYSQETANSDSIGSLVIYRRDTRKVVATLHTRPKPHSKFHQDIMLLLDYYNAKVFMENADMEFKTYLDAISPNHADRYLYRSVNFLTDMELSQWDRVEIRDFGWAPTTKNKKTLFGLAVKEASNTYKSFEEDGDHRVYMGYENFKDPRILQEIVSWKPHGNFDGLTALMGALGIDFYLTFSGITFTDDIQVTKEKSKPSRPVDRHRSSFGSSNRSSLSTTRNRQIKSNF